MSPSAVAPLFFAFALALAPAHAREGEAVPDPGPQGPGRGPFDAGVAHLGGKDARAALVSFEACLAAEPAKSALAIECHWEAGWAAWLLGDWRTVATHWERVQAQDPDRDGLEDYLAQARDNLGLMELLARGREGAPTYKSTAPAGAKVRLRAVGDLMIGTDFPEGVLPPDDAKGMFDDVAAWLGDADVTFGNLEGPICDSGETKKCKPGAPEGSCYAFRSPSRYVHIYKKAGFDVMSTANNHAADFGPGCRLETEKHLDAMGIAHSGRPGDFASLQANGLKIALVGFHTSRNSHYVNDHAEAATIVRALATDHDLVIVSFHGGAEGSKALHVPDGPETFYSENRGDLRRFTHAVVDAGADLVLGHGPHVLRGMEIYNDRLIAYSLGNFATYGRFSLGGNLGVGAVLEVVLDKQGRFQSGKILPTKQIGAGVPMKDETNAAIDLVRTLSESDFPGSGVRVAVDGGLTRP